MINIKSVVSGNLELYESFVPSLGLYNYKDDKRPSVNALFRMDVVEECQPFPSGVKLRPVGSLTSIDPAYPAGTDCIGFAKRSMSWMFDNTKANNYSWINVPKGWAEGGRLSFDHTWQMQRTYPRCYLKDGTGDPDYDADYAIASYEIFTRTKDEFIYIVESPEKYINEQADLSHVVPGDIWYTENSHIAIVSSVEWSADGKVSDVLLVESTFSTQEATPNPQFVRSNERLTLKYLKKAWDKYRIVRLQ